MISSHPLQIWKFSNYKKNKKNKQSQLQLISLKTQPLKLLISKLYALGLLSTFTNAQQII